MSEIISESFLPENAHHLWHSVPFVFCFSVLRFFLLIINETRSIPSFVHCECHWNRFIFTNSRKHRQIQTLWLEFAKNQISFIQVGAPSNKRWNQFQEGIFKTIIWIPELSKVNSEPKTQKIRFYPVMEFL